MEDDVRDTELLKRSSASRLDRSHVGVIYSTFCVPVHFEKKKKKGEKKEYIVSYLFCSLSIIILIDYVVYECINGLPHTPVDCSDVLHRHTGGESAGSVTATGLVLISVVFRSLSYT